MQLSIVFLRTFSVLMVYFSPILVMFAIIITGFGIFVGIIEEFSWNEGLYFGWITATTVGYGDYTPTQPLTRMLSILISMIGIINTGLIVSIAVVAGKEAAKYLGFSEEMVKKAVEGQK